MNAILYTLLFVPELDHAKAVQLAGLIQADRALPGGVDRYRRAVHDALAQGQPVGDGMPTPHGEAELRAFLADLGAVLDLVQG